MLVREHLELSSPDLALHSHFHDFFGKRESKGAVHSRRRVSSDGGSYEFLVLFREVVIGLLEVVQLLAV